MKQQLLENLKSTRQWWQSATPVVRWRVILGAIALGIVIWLIDADKPWKIAEAAGDRWRVPHYAGFYLWWAAAVNLVLVGVLAALCPWWLKLKITPPAIAWPVTKTPRMFWPLVGAAALTLLLSAWPRMDISFWDDEDYTVRRFVLGVYERDSETNEPYLKTVNWQQTFFDYRKPNNHLFFSIFSRISLNTWQTFAQDPPGVFSEEAVRLPALIFGLGAVVFTAWLLKLAGLAWPGVTAAWLLALHPWMVRYASEARGYSMAMALMVLMLGAWMLALRTGQWKWWWIFGAAQFALLYTYPATLFLPVLLNLLTPLVLWISKMASGSWMAQMGRWFVANTVGAMVAIQLMLPLVPQMMEYLKTDEAAGTNINQLWFANVGSSFMSGVVWNVAQQPKFPQLSMVAADNPRLFPVMVVLFCALPILGMVALFRRSWISGAVGLVLVGAAAVTILNGLYKNMFLHIWYLVFLLPGLMLLIAAGGALAIRWISGRAVRWTLGFSLVVLYAAFSQAPRAWLIENSMAPMKESSEIVDHMLSATGNFPADHILVSFGTPPILYNPAYIHPRVTRDFVELIQKAEEENKPLIVNIGHLPYAPGASPQLFKLLMDPVLFREWFRVDGYDEACDRLISRYIPGGAKDYDFSQLDMDSR